MKKLSFFILTLCFIFTFADIHAQDYADTNDLEDSSIWIASIVFVANHALISGAEDNTLSAWQIITPSRAWTKNVGAPIYDIAVPSHDPAFVAYGGEDDYNIRMRYIDDGDWRGRVKGHTDSIVRLAFKPDSYYLASASTDHTIRIWDMESSTNPRHIRTLRGHTDAVYSVAWSPDGQTLASASLDGTVRLWNPNNGINFAVLRGHREGVLSVAWSPDGEMIASGSHDTTVRIWDSDTHTTLRVLRVNSRWLYTVAWHPDGQILAVASSGDNASLWNPTTGKRKATLVGSRDSLGVPKGYTSVAWSPDGQTLAGGGWGFIRLWIAIDADVTGNGSVTVWDIWEVAHPDNYNKPTDKAKNPRADVNKNGIVNIEDLILVAKAVDAVIGVSGAPPLAQQHNQLEMPTNENTPGIPFTAADVQQWLNEAKTHNVDASGIAALESLLALLVQPEIVVLPKQTALFTNYPNPFNPETWIPYQLAEPTDVSVEIHAADGTLVRSLALGQLPGGVYQSKARAAYWDGQNTQGEPVASGVYFYTLKAGEFFDTRKMLIRK